MCAPPTKLSALARWVRIWSSELHDDLEVSESGGTLFGGPYKKGSYYLGYYIGSPIFANPHLVRRCCAIAVISRRNAKSRTGSIPDLTYWGCMVVTTETVQFERISL